MTAKYTGRRSALERAGSLLAVLCTLWVLASPAAGAFLVNLGYQYLRLLEHGKVVHHDLRIRLDPPAYAAYFTDDLTVRATRNTQEMYITLGVDFAIDKVTTTDGKELPHRVALRLGALPFTVYRIDLAERLTRDAVTTLRITYHFSPETAQYTFPYLSEDIFFAVIPMFWYPQMPTEGFFHATMHYEGPDSLTMIAEGAPVPGTGGKTWETVVPVPGLGLAIGNFLPMVQEVDGRTVYAWQAPRLAGRAHAVAKRTAEALAFYEQLLGPLSLERLDVVQLPFGLGGSVGQYSLLIYDDMNDEIPLDNEVMLAYMAAHEAAHKWIGFTAGLRLLGTTWISEGLTDYLAFLAVEHMYGTEGMREVIYERAIKPLANHTGRIRSLPSIDVIDDDLEVAYQKGSLVFRALHRRLGDEAFFRLVRTFVQEYAQDHATSNDFLSLLNRLGGTQVQRFVADWINGTQQLDYTLTDVRTEPAGQGERVSFRVASAGRLTEPGPVDVMIELADGRAELVSVSLGERASFTFDQPVARITVDPDYWLPDWHRANNVWTAAN